MQPSRRRLLIAAVILLAVAALLVIFRGHEVRAVLGRTLALISAGIDFIASFGPWAFFIAMAVLPGLAVPATAFTLTVGKAFGQSMGMGWVLVAGLAATVVNYVLTYWLGRTVLRGWLGALFERLGYKLPEVPKGDATDLVVILRVTPGIPLCVQNYLCGLADVPAGRYFVVSFILGLPNTAAFIYFGEALTSGKGTKIMGAMGILVALAAATHLFRRHLAQRKSAP